METESDRKYVEKDDETKLYDIPGRIARQSCPFYGFDLVYAISVQNRNEGRNLMVDWGGGQCALSKIIASLSSNCDQERPNWAGCPFNTAKNRSKLLDCPKKITVYPKDFPPTGISLENWIEYVGGEKLKNGN